MIISGGRMDRINQLGGVFVASAQPQLNNLSKLLHFFRMAGQ